MKIQQAVYTPSSGWNHSGSTDIQPQLVLAFAPLEVMEDSERHAEIRAMFPNANIVSASTSGDISGNQVLDDAFVVTALEFQKTTIKVAKLRFEDSASAFDLGKALFRELNQDQLCGILVISDGLVVNGSELVGGLNFSNSKKVPVTGGLAGDNARFIRTVVGLDNHREPGLVVGIGFYGSNLRIGHGTRGGWDPFGPERVVTRSDRNVLYELDNQSALALYKKYLGDLSSELPGSALLFPLNMKLPDSSETLVRTILNVDEKEQSMTFAGNLPQGARVQFMKANFDRVIDASAGAAGESMQSIGLGSPEFALLISCVGRKIVLGQRVEDEVEEAVDAFGKNTVITGFYSNGEISPLQPVTRCELHNQTMTITTFREAE